MMPTIAGMPAAAGSTETVGPPFPVGNANKKGRQEHYQQNSERRETINSMDIRNNRAPGTPATEKAWLEQSESIIKVNKQKSRTPATAGMALQQKGSNYRSDASNIRDSSDSSDANNSNDAGNSSDNRATGTPAAAHELC
jgi:hypothetical protein